MLIEVALKYSISEIIGYLKAKSSLIIFDRHVNLKYKYGNRHFWCRGYYVDTAGKNSKKIQEYIKNQLKENYMADQISIKEFIDPFTGEQVNKSRKKGALAPAVKIGARDRKFELWSAAGNSSL